MDSSEMVSFYKWITQIGVIVFVAFSYFYFGPVSEVESELNNLNEQIVVENATIDNTTNNSTKRQLIQANLARAENAAAKSTTLMINRIAVILFMVVGLVATLYGLRNLKRLMAQAEEEEI